MSYSIVIDSCDKYADCWLPMSQCLDKFWNGIGRTSGTPVYLLTDGSGKYPVHIELEKSVYTDTITINTRDFGELLKKALKEIDEDYVFLLLDDQLPGALVDSKAVESYVELMEGHDDIGAIYTEASSRAKEWGYQDYAECNDYYEIPFGTLYRMILGPALWRREFLISILNDQDTAWDFERIDSFRDITASMKVLSPKYNAFVRCAPVGAIEKGMWLRSMKKFASDNGIEADFSGRKMQSGLDIVKSHRELQIM